MPTYYAKFSGGQAIKEFKKTSIDVAWLILIDGKPLAKGLSLDMSAALDTTRSFIAERTGRKLFNRVVKRKGRPRVNRPEEDAESIIREHGGVEAWDDRITAQESRYRVEYVAVSER